MFHACHPARFSTWAILSLEIAAMPRREPTPWKRKSDAAYYIQLDGKQRYLFTNKAKAFAKYHELMQREHIPRTTCTAKQLVTSYVYWMGQNRAKTTAESREPLLLAFRDSLPNTLKAEQVKPHYVITWIAGGSCNSTTTNYRISIVQAVWNWGVSMCMIEVIPLAKMEKPRRKIRQLWVPHERWDGNGHSP
jgi:hypothetical protein